MNFWILSAGTIIIAIFSWYFSLRSGRYHGIPRFFSFESIFILLVLNIRIWFSDPFSARQILSWIALCLSAWTGLEGYFRLRFEGKAKGQFENTSQLVKSGIYGVVRHPLYLSLFLLGTGIMFKKPEVFQIILGIVNLVAVSLTALTEEKEMLAKFGDEYRQYMKETRMFIPYIL